MNLFKNEVGRPSNETLRKRKVVIASLVVLTVMLVGAGIYFCVGSFNKRDVSSKGMNIEQNSKNYPNVLIEAINLSNNKKISATKNKSLLLTGWRNYKVRFKVVATSPEKGTTIKSIKWNWNAGGITSTNKSNYMSWIGNKTFNSASANLDYNAEGARSGSVVVTDSKGRKTAFQIGANIDLTKPKLKMAWKDLISAGHGYYYVGSSGIITCTDSLSGVTKAETYEAKKTSNKTTGTSSAVIVLKNSGINYFVGTCTDNAGNVITHKSTEYHYVPDMRDAYSISVTRVSGNAADWTNKNVKLTVSAQATHGIQSYSFDNGKTWQSGPSKIFDKNQTVYIKVKDKKGHVSKNFVVQINKIDKTAPTISFTMQTKQEERGKYPLGSKVLVKCTDSTSGVTYMEAWSTKLTSNRSSTGSQSSNGVSTKSLNMYIKTSGTGRQIAATCKDKAGNSSTKYSNKWTILK